ncbi:hypothetical protein H4582DRAFT_2056933 [Lactarius indigo]|nr:hypothetical protein H4582DRAFT_2056933 [Lactarius indigo]
MHFLHLYVMSIALVASASALVVAPTLKPAEKPGDDEAKTLAATATSKLADNEATGVPFGCKKPKKGLPSPPPRTRHRWTRSECDPRTPSLLNATRERQLDTIPGFTYTLNGFFCYLNDVIVHTPHHRKNKRAHAGGVHIALIQEKIEVTALHAMNIGQPSHRSYSNYGFRMTENMDSGAKGNHISVGRSSKSRPPTIDAHASRCEHTFSRPKNPTRSGVVRIREASVFQEEKLTSNSVLRRNPQWNSSTIPGGNASTIHGRRSPEGPLEAGEVTRTRKEAPERDGGAEPTTEIHALLGLDLVLATGTIQGS